MRVRKLQSTVDDLGVEASELMLLALGDVEAELGVGLGEGVVELLPDLGLDEGVLQLQQRGLGPRHAAAWLPVEAGVVLVAQVEHGELVLVGCGEGRRVLQVRGQDVGGQVAELVRVLRVGQSVPVGRSRAPLEGAVPVLGELPDQVSVGAVVVVAVGGEAHSAGAGVEHGRGGVSDGLSG